MNGTRWASIPAEFSRAISRQTFQLLSRRGSVINLNTAKELGLKVPPLLLATADEVIE
jgi:hypothetical protein